MEALLVGRAAVSGASKPSHSRLEPRGATTSRATGSYYYVELQYEELQYVAP